MFGRLAVFAGGCTLEAAEAVCEVDLDTLQSLAEKSLARRTGAGCEGKALALDEAVQYALSEPS